MNQSKFELALNQTKSSDWEAFEKLCSSFLANEHPSMRTMASPSGDGGRDSQLFNPDNINIICSQYSVSADWEAKIKKTLKRLKDGFPDVTVLIYMTNQEIGAKADDIRKECLQNRIFLDVRDKNWFLDRWCQDDLKANAALEYFEKIGRRYLEDQNVVDKFVSPLSTDESKAALVYLGLQWEDSNTDKGLTKLSFEALLRVALRNSTSENRMTKQEIYEKIYSLLPSHDKSIISSYIDSAINRLGKTVIKHFDSDNTYHLSHEERTKLDEALSLNLNQKQIFDDKIKSVLVSIDDKLSDELIALFSDILKNIIYLSLIKSGENFASSVSNGIVKKLEKSQIDSIIYEEISKKSTLLKSYQGQPSEILNRAFELVLGSSDDCVRKHLKVLSDTYTLFSFLRETPDVQKLTKKIFSFGKIWLDTTLVLPILADDLIEDKSNIVFSSIIKNLTSSGVKLYISTGTVNEVLNHIKLCIKCSRSSTLWNGRVPFLFNKYMQSGRNRKDFEDWVKKFREFERPEEDIKEYLKLEHGIEYSDLEMDYNTASDKDKYNLEKLWREAHQQRRSNGLSLSESEAIEILIKNDVISYLGILQKRNKESNSELGYQNWWLTTDSTAWSISKTYKEKSSPLMSLDFIVQNLSFGPMKNKINRSNETLLPVLLDMDIYQVVPVEIINLAERVREENSNEKEFIIRRRVRDACDKARRKIGAYSFQNLDSLADIKII